MNTDRPTDKDGFPLDFVKPGTSTAELAIVLAFIWTLDWHVGLILMVEKNIQIGKCFPEHARASFASRASW